MELSILMPCLNEARTLGACLAEARAFLERSGVEGELLVADNGSTDGSREIARAAGATVIEVPTRGYGSALWAGIHAARGRYVVMGDSDLSYDFSKLELFLERLRAGDQLVMGNRFRGGIEAGAMPFLHRYLGNPVLSGLGVLFFGGEVRDFHCGLRGFDRQSVLDLQLRSPGMEFASELVIKALLRGYRISEVPTVLRADGRDRAPHLRTWRDGWRHLCLLLFFSPRWLFVAPGLVLFLAGLGGSLVLFFTPLRLGVMKLDAGTMAVFCLLWVVGFHLLGFGLCARHATTQQGLLPASRWVGRMQAPGFLEAMLVLASVVILIGAGLIARDFGFWREAGFGALDPQVHLRRIILGSTLICLGIQSFSISFYLSLIRSFDL